MGKGDRIRKSRIMGGDKLDPEKMVKTGACPKCQGDLRLHLGARKWECLRCRRTFEAIMQPGTPLTNMDIDIIDPRKFVVRYRARVDGVTAKELTVAEFRTEDEARAFIKPIRDVVADLSLHNAPWDACKLCGVYHLQACDDGPKLMDVAHLIKRTNE